MEESGRMWETGWWMQEAGPSLNTSSSFGRYIHDTRRRPSVIIILHFLLHLHLLHHGRHFALASPGLRLHLHLSVPVPTKNMYITFAASTRAREIRLAHCICTRFLAYPMYTGMYPYPHTCN